MARTISIGAQGFEELRTNGYFYVDKSDFVRDWWLKGDVVTLVCRPRRFGKTLNLDTVRCFLSTDLAGRGEELFDGLAVWEDPSMRALQGTVPVVMASFADVKAPTWEGAFTGIRQVVRGAVEAHAYLLESPSVSAGVRAFLARVYDGMDYVTAATALQQLCTALRSHWGVRPVLLLDEYDAPMERAWTGGYWDEASDFMRSLMNSTFKTNPALGRGLITGVTRVSRESIFSDLNNLEVVTTSSEKYRTAFGFTQGEVDSALLEYGLAGKAEDVRRWYDGFTFGGYGHIYNPWSVTKFLEAGGRFRAYWSNTSSNSLASKVVKSGGARFKADFEELMRGGSVKKIVDEQVVFSELATRTNAVWSLLLAAGYITAPGPIPEYPEDVPRELVLTNLEVSKTFDRMVETWFGGAEECWDDLPAALFAGDLEGITDCLEDVTLYCMSSFDGARHPAESEPERFYHGLVLGLLARLRGRWSVESNRESGRGRYDVALVPNDGADGSDPAVVMEFKVFDGRREKTLEDTVLRAKEQIDKQSYVAGLVARGIALERIRIYGIAFHGKEVLVG